MRSPASPCSARWRCSPIPLAQSFLHLSPRAYGLWAGSSIHEIAQAVAAAFQGGGDAGQFGTIAKLTRVAMMAPVVIALGEMSALLGLAGEGERRRPPFPWFLIGFLALAALNSLVAIPHEIAAPIGVGATFLLSMAMAAMGLHTDLRHIRSRGLGRWRSACSPRCSSAAPVW